MVQLYVTAAKVALINRVDQLYEEGSVYSHGAGRRITTCSTWIPWGQATGPNGPCSCAVRFTQVASHRLSLSTTRARFVIGQIIGASNYDVGHLALGEPGGGVANLGVVGERSIVKLAGAPASRRSVGDFYAVDYVRA